MTCIIRESIWFTYARLVEFHKQHVLIFSQERIQNLSTANWLRHLAIAFFSHKSLSNISSNLGKIQMAALIYLSSLRSTLCRLTLRLQRRHTEDLNHCHAKNREAL